VRSGWRCGSCMKSQAGPQCGENGAVLAVDAAIGDGSCLAAECRGVQTGSRVMPSQGAASAGASRAWGEDAVARPRSDHCGGAAAGWHIPAASCPREPVEHAVNAVCEAVRALPGATADLSPALTPGALTARHRRSCRCRLALVAVPPGPLRADPRCPRRPGCFVARSVSAVPSNGSAWSATQLWGGWIILLHHLVGRGQARTTVSFNPVATLAGVLDDSFGAGPAGATVRGSVRCLGAGLAAVRALSDRRRRPGVDSGPGPPGRRHRLEPPYRASPDGPHRPDPRCRAQGQSSHHGGGAGWHRRRGTAWRPHAGTTQARMRTAVPVPREPGPPDAGTKDPCPPRPRSIECVRPYKFAVGSSASAVTPRKAGARCHCSMCSSP
jgi:hypothetical protein